MKNLEIKYRIDDPDGIRDKLSGIPGVEFQYSHYQKDIYFNTKEVRVKIRLEDEKSPCLIQYYRENTDTLRESDFEITPLSDYQILLNELAQRVGILMEVEKQRELYLYKNVRIHLDNVESLGWFLEFEAMVSNENNLERCHSHVADIMEEIQPYLIEPQSLGYLELMLRKNFRGG